MDILLQLLYKTDSIIYHKSNVSLTTAILFESQNLKVEAKTQK